MAVRFLLMSNRTVRNAMQVLSLAIISCTLIIYQVTSAKNELLAQQSREMLNNAVLEDLVGTANPDMQSMLRSSGDDNLVENTIVSDKNKNNTSNSSESGSVRVDRSVVAGNGVEGLSADSWWRSSQKEGSGNGGNPSSREVKHNSLSTLLRQATNQVRKSASAKEGLVVDNVFLSVKSTKRFHQTRLKPIVKTWFSFAKDQTWIFTDDDDPELEQQTNGHIINTHCPATHYRQALCCKMSQEFDAFLRTTKSWFCHFDDDNYVNVPALLELLGKYNHWEDWYLGKPSLKGPIHIPDPNNRTEEVSFWFATGGAGFCISRALALRMSPLASGGKFIKVCDRIQLPDDVTVGYIVGHLLGQNLTVIPQFHSHFETMKFIDMKNPHSEITFSYVRYDTYENILDVKGLTEEEDPTRFLSLHCLLYPNFSYCINR